LLKNQTENFWAKYLSKTHLKSEISASIAIFIQLLLGIGFMFASCVDIQVFGKKSNIIILEREREFSVYFHRDKNVFISCYGDAQRL
jgi:hypothetical protein